MEQDTRTTLSTDRCGHCGGSVRPGAPWCTLCLTPTGAAAVPEPAVQEPVGRAPTRAQPRGKHAAPAEVDATGWPCAFCSHPNPLAATACTACGAGFLEAVSRTEPPLLVLPWLGDVSRLTKLQWSLLGAGLLLLLLVVLVTAGALL